MLDGVRLEWWARGSGLCAPVAFGGPGSEGVRGWSRPI